MIGYVMVGTNDIQRAGAFYDALLAEMGAKRMMQTDSFIAWSAKSPGVAFSITKPYDGRPATIGNGVMVALAAGSAERVQALHKKALQLGAKDEGAPGARGAGFYAAYFRDLDGNKLNFFHMG